ncbi:MAG: hypothetical protein HN778_07735 [Prolixibacteraceae bacterium]|jgi:hypothetical protein|nr:hypothetical protein [Prolixibacteraceae bacterium]MBT6765985.1 hypothetical protein [Prolixibacteraceae bacterium]MBT6997296.1 hypothetical protein [Prolixibacteraceae bacterium]MBT7394708.1 hypothetical protein [Prolixibacteraceae bacterium]
MNTREKKIILNNNYLPSFGYFRAFIFTYHNNENRQIKYILLLLLGIISFISVSAKPEELATKYNIQMLGVRIGEFSVTQASENGNVNIKAITDVKINLLFSYRIKYVQRTVYEQGILQSSLVEIYKNGKLNSTIWMKLEKGSYLLITDKDTSVIHDLIEYSGSLIYFNEPKGIKKIYKERNSEMRQLEAVSEHTYIIKDEKEKELNRYFYENGILQSAKMRHKLGTVQLHRINKQQ